MNQVICDNEMSRAIMKADKKLYFLAAVWKSRNQHG
jgi:hypothetical protein